VRRLIFPRERSSHKLSNHFRFNRTLCLCSKIGLIWATIATVFALSAPSSEVHRSIPKLLQDFSRAASSSEPVDPFFNPNRRMEWASAIGDLRDKHFSNFTISDYVVKDVSVDQNLTKIRATVSWTTTSGERAWSPESIKLIRVQGVWYFDDPNFWRLEIYPSFSFGRI